MLNPPSGTVTFLFTDIDGSASQCEQDSPKVQAALRSHEQILRSAVEANGGYVYKIAGQTSQSAFSTAAHAMQAVLDAQRTLHSEAWDEGCGLGVKMALHTGVTEERGDDYVGPLLNRAARLLAAGHGGQILLTHATAMLALDNLPDGATLEDLGEHRLKDLFRPERVYQLAAPQLGLPPQFPPLNSLQARPNNLPLQPTLFLGRDREVAEVRDTLSRDDVYLLTLTGPGGIGKSRLALQVAAELIDQFEDGVFFVPLASVSDPALVTNAIAQALGIREVGGQSLQQTLSDYLKNKHLLLLLDNFEQVMDADVQVAELLKASPGLKVLVTSRASLHLSIQHEYPVLPMRVPSSEYRVPSEGHANHSVLRAPFRDGTRYSLLLEYESVQLFVQRAQSVKPDFELNYQNASAVAEICSRLEGIPLAIELAAARIKALPPQALLAKLDSHVLSGAEGRLKILTGGARDLHTRQQTLRNTFEWSYDLLTGGEKQLFRRLAVFRGGETLEGAEAVCTGSAPEAGNASPLIEPLEIDLLDGIGSLVDKSLMYEAESPGGEARYTMLETINEYAWEKLRESGEANALQRAHALYFMTLAEQAEPELKGANQAQWLARLEAEHDNLRAVLRWAGQPYERGPAAAGEGPHLAPSPEEIRLRIAGAIWRFWYVRGYFSEGREQLARSLASQSSVLLPRSSARARALNGAGVLANLQGDYAAAREFDREGLAIVRELGDKQSIPSFLDNLGIMARQQGDYATARTLYEESLAVRREIGDKRGIAISLDNLGIVFREQGDTGAARSLYEESLALRREIGDKQGIAVALSNFGNALQASGDYASAHMLLEESLALRREIGDKRGIAISLNNLGIVVQLQGDYQAARLLLEEGLALVRELGDRQGIGYLLHNLGNLTRQQGDAVAARSLYMESLALRREMGDRRGIAASLLGLGGLAVETTGGVEQIEKERGVRLLGAARALFEALGAVPDTADHLQYEQSIAAARADLGEELFDKAWSSTLR